MSDKKRVLIGLFGLPRTFKDTSKLLFERLIEPNMNKYSFDIMINTDMEAAKFTAQRPDTPKYNDVNILRNDLTHAYNRYNQLKDITIYNYKSTSLIFHWFLPYRRIQMILQNLYKTNRVYDIYMMIRLDYVIDRTFLLDEVDNELLFITINRIRNGVLHHRDTVDIAFIGNYRPFILWILFTCDLFKAINELKSDNVNFFTDEPICNLDMIEESQKMVDDDTCFDEIEKRLKLYHTPGDFVDIYHVNDRLELFSFRNHYGIPFDVFHQRILMNMNKILCDHNIILGENKAVPLHSVICDG